MLFLFLFFFDFFWGLLFLGDDGYVLLWDFDIEGYVLMFLILVVFMLDFLLVGFFFLWVFFLMIGFVFFDFNFDIIRDCCLFLLKWILSFLVCCV